MRYKQLMYVTEQGRFKTWSYFIAKKESSTLVYRYSDMKINTKTQPKPLG